MGPVDVVLEVRRLGGRLLVRDGRPVCQAPKGAISPELAQGVREHSEVVVALIKAEHENEPIPIVPHSPNGVGAHPKFWFSIYRHWVCAECHPPAHERLVAVQPKL